VGTSASQDRVFTPDTIILAAASILAALCVLPNTPPTLAQSDAAPATCRVGLDLRCLGERAHLDVIKYRGPIR
jgi:hypothetical protein